MFKRVSNALVTGAITLAMVAASVMPAFAASAYTPIAGTTTSFDKKLVLESDAKSPNVTFTYTIAPGTARPASDGKLAVLAGPAGASVGNASFASSDTRETGQDYIKKSVEVSFADCSYPEPGVYRYVLTEQENGLAGITYDTEKSTKTRYIDVFIQDNNGNLEVQGYSLHAEDNDVPVEGGTLADKSTGFTNSVETHDLTISKAVSGNQAAKDKYFKFTLELSNAAPNTTFPVTLTGVATTPTNQATASANQGKTNPTEVTTDASGAATVDFYLSDTDSILIKGITPGAKYTVTEVPEDYTPATSTTEGDAAAVAGTAAAVSDTSDGITGDTTIAYTNSRTGVVPTGVMLNMVPFMVLAGGAIVVIAALGRKKQH